MRHPTSAPHARLRPFGLAAGALLAFAGCIGKNGTAPPYRDTGLDLAVLDSLFTHFAPEYNFDQEETTLLAHVAQVTYPGAQPWQAATGSRDSAGSEVVGPNTIFRVGSATKLFTAVVVLQLWEEGSVELDAPFVQYLPLDEATHPNIGKFSQVTVRDLLGHRSGIPRISSTTFFDVYGYTDPVSQWERMRFLFTEGEPEFYPGSDYAYRNSNFNILGLVIEAVTGEPYHQVLRERIHTPLGLEHTFLLDYDISPDDPRIAHGVTQGFDGVDYHGSHAWAAGALMSTAADLSTFLAALVGGDLFQGAGTFTEMITPRGGSSYGLGIFLSQTPEGPAYGHGGAVFGYHTRLEYFPNRGTIVASTMSFDGYDFQAANWNDDFCLPIVAEIRRAQY